MRVIERSALWMQDTVVGLKNTVMVAMAVQLPLTVSCDVVHEGQLHTKMGV